MRAQITHARSLWVRSPYLTSLPIWSNQPSKGTTCSAPAAAAAGCEEEEGSEEEEEEDADDADADDADADDAGEEEGEEEEEAGEEAGGDADGEEEEEEEEDSLRRLPGPCVLIINSKSRKRGRHESIDSPSLEFGVLSMRLYTNILYRVVSCVGHIKKIGFRVRTVQYSTGYSSTTVQYCIHTHTTPHNITRQIVNANQ